MHVGVSTQVWMHFSRVPVCRAPVVLMSQNILLYVSKCIDRADCDFDDEKVGRGRGGGEGNSNQEVTWDEETKR